MLEHFKAHRGTLVVNLDKPIHKGDLDPLQLQARKKPYQIPFELLTKKNATHFGLINPLG